MRVTGAPRGMILGLGALLLGLFPLAVRAGQRLAATNHYWAGRATGHALFAQALAAFVLGSVALAIFALVTSVGFLRFEERRPRTGYWVRHCLQGFFLCAVAGVVLLVIFYPVF